MKPKEVLRVVAAIQRLDHPLEIRVEMDCGHTFTVSGLGARLKVGDTDRCPLCERQAEE